MLHDTIGAKEVENMSDKIYNASVKSKQRKFNQKTRRLGPREITISVIGIGVVLIPQKVGKGIPLSIGDKLQVKLLRKLMIIGLFLRLSL